MDVVFRLVVVVGECGLYGVDTLTGVLSRLMIVVVMVLWVTEGVSATIGCEGRKCV